MPKFLSRFLFNLLMRSPEMSWFGDLWVKERNAFEAAAVKVWDAIEPDLKTAVVASIQAGVGAALAKGGTPGDQFVAGRNAAVAVLKDAGSTIATDAVHALAAGAVVDANTTAS